MNPTSGGVGKIVFLSGPSSSGKTSLTRPLEEQGWMRIEADTESMDVQINSLKPSLFAQITYIESHFTNPTASDLLLAIYDDKRGKEPADLFHYNSVRSELRSYINTRETDFEQRLLIHMLDKAITASSLGKNVILDHVHFINDAGFSSHEVRVDSTSPNLWVYKDFKIEQQLKYVPIDILMRNVIQRNNKCLEANVFDDMRPMPMVLEQYSVRFKAITEAGQESVGTIKVENLKKWIERAIKIEFVDINPNHGFKYEGSLEGLDSTIQARLEDFEKEMADPEQAIDPKGEKVGAQNRERLKEKALEYPFLQKKIEETQKTLLRNMQIPEDKTEVKLTYVSSSGIKPILVRE